MNLNRIFESVLREAYEVNDDDYDERYWGDKTPDNLERFCKYEIEMNSDDNLENDYLLMDPAWGEKNKENLVRFRRYRAAHPDFGWPKTKEQFDYIRSHQED
jgi:hypothetical protein